MNPEILLNFILSIAGVIMIVAAIHDIKSFRIPNVTSLSLVALFPVYVFLAPVTIAWEMHLLVFVIIFVLGYLVYLKNWLGAGDVKLLAAVGLWAGPTHIVPYLFITTVSGGILAIGIAALSLVRHRLKHDPKEEFPSLKMPIPYGLAIAIGGLCTLALLSHPDLLQAKG